jgi:lipoic acid synthetase
MTTHSTPSSPSETGPGTGVGSRALQRHPRPLGGDPARNLRPLLSLSEMILNNRTAESHQLAVKRKPDWLRAKVPGGEGYKRTKSNIATNRLHTVCEEAACPNLGECWARGVATIMILGDTCTRACGFCNVKTGKPPVIDWDEPERVAESLRGLGLRYVVITSVDRDDLPDGGAGIWAETIRRVKDACPDMKLEVLVGDFKGNRDDIDTVIDAGADVVAHNLETVRRCHPAVRPSARYERTMEVLRRIKEQGAVAKTGIMVGIGERDDEVIELFDDLVAMTSDHTGPRDPRDLSRGDPCDIITIGQYLQPTRNHLPIDRWVHPDRFAQFETMGKAAGIKVVFSGPLVRSSYLADKQFDGLTLPGTD